VIIGPRLVAALLIAVAVTGCSPDQEAVPPPSASDDSESPSPATGPSGGTRSAEHRKFRREPIPRRAALLARELVLTERRLDREITEWLASGGSLRTAGVVARDALRQQKIYRLLVDGGSRARRVVGRLPDSFARRVARHVRVAAAVRAGLDPLETPIRLKTVRAASPHVLRRTFEKAQRRYGIHWTVLAAINFVESRFGRLPGPSSAGAVGPMQFLPATWARYGMGGNIRDPRDAIPAAARLLAANGGRRHIRRALFAYNQSVAYVDAVLTYASEMKRDPRTYYAYYFWQVFVVTTKGVKQLTRFERQ
jgi:transglycosylase-like protein with SLT domain